MEDNWESRNKLLEFLKRYQEFNGKKNSLSANGAETMSSPSRKNVDPYLISDTKIN